MKKIIGWLLIAPILCLGVFAFYYNITHAGWYFILSMVIILALGGLAVLGLYLISKD